MHPTETPLFDSRLASRRFDDVTTLKFNDAYRGPRENGIHTAADRKSFLKKSDRTEQKTPIVGELRPSLAGVCTPWLRRSRFLLPYGGRNFETAGRRQSTHEPYAFLEYLAFSPIDCAPASVSGSTGFVQRPSVESAVFILRQHDTKHGRADPL